MAEARRCPRTSTPGFSKPPAILREMAERAPERARAMERFKTEGTEESWLEAQKLLGIPQRLRLAGFDGRVPAKKRTLSPLYRGPF